MVLCVTSSTVRAQAAGAQGGWSAVEQALGRPGAAQADSVVRFSFPRTDLRVTVDGVQLRPALALGSWLAFHRIPGGAMAMGDLVLTDSEVAPVTVRLQQTISLTAVHNHLLRESPRVVYMHVEAHGDPVRIAEEVRAALALTHTPLGPPPPAGPAEPIELDTAAVARALGRSGRVNGGVYQVSVPRRETIRDGGQVVPPAMGVATAINFQPTGGGRAAVTGDFVMTADEVRGVMRTLRAHGIEVTALHSHLLNEQPRLFFMHFWANDNAVRLAAGLGAALSGMAVRR
ncbi:MAG TPA: DUF1259 domain-containing protein [Longimicrobium sp.]|nr:DUF1259 domain-containing protein [Longimicrobium sp.]